MAGVEASVSPECPRRLRRIQNLGEKRQMQLTRSRKFMTGLGLAAALTLAGVGFAQQTTHQGQGDKDHAGRRWNQDGAQGEHGFGGPFSKLNLTDDQKAKMQQIADSYRQTFKAERQHEGGNKQRRQRPRARRPVEGARRARPKVQNTRGRRSGSPSTEGLPLPYSPGCKLTARIKAEG